MMTEPWKGKISNIEQLGGIETSILDNGPARGSRIAWVNTGSGLRYKVAIDRCLDIADAFYNQHSLAWLSHVGLTSPKDGANSGREWLYAFGGGLLTTCGLRHIGGGESDETETRGIHGRISNTAATVESVIQPDPARGRLEMSITAKIKESKVFGPHLELKRTITSVLGKSLISIRDEVTNQGNTPCPHMLLYHCNFGWPLVDQGTDIVYEGSCRSRGRSIDDELFSENCNYKKCREPLDSHKAGGDACGFIDVAPNADGTCEVALVNVRLKLSVILSYKKQQLPALTNWQHWGPREYVCGLEPGTNFPIGQNKAREMNELIMLMPDESRTYQLDIRTVTV